MNRGLAWILLITMAVLAIGLLTDDAATPTVQGNRAQQTTAGKVSPASTDSHRPLLAVVPFRTVSSGPDDDYFARGFSQELLRRLAHNPSVTLVARASSFRFTGPAQAIEAAAALGASHVVTGTVHRAGERLDIKAELWRLADGVTVPLQPQRGRSDDASVIAAQTARLTAAGLDLPAPARPAKAIDTVAMTEHEKGLSLFIRAHQGGDMISLLRQANIHFERAIEKSPHYLDAHVAAADLFIHVLLKSANGQLDGNIRPGDQQEAAQHLRRLYDGAIRGQSGSPRRTVAMADRAILLPDARALATAAARPLLASGCMAADWGHLVTGPFGSARALSETFHSMTQCDPLSAHTRANLAWAQLWSGQLQEAVRTASHEPLQTDAWLTEARLIALSHSGRGERARSLLRNFRAADRRAYAAFLIAAAEGDTSLAAQQQQRYLASHGPNDRAALVMYALSGNRHAANRTAAEIDRRPGGHLALLNAIFQCACGAPFDLDAAPQFSAMIAASGLQWPPVQPLGWPLKPW